MPGKESDYNSLLIRILATRLVVLSSPPPPAYLSPFLSDARVIFLNDVCDYVIVLFIATV